MLKNSVPIFALFITACANNPSISEDFGEAVRNNIAVQTINPDAGGEDDSQMLEGQQVQRALERYRTGPAEVENESLINDVGG